MAARLDPVKRLRLSLGLNQGAFGKTVKAVQSTVSDWEQGAALPSSKALVVWKTYGARLRRMGVKLEDLLRRRNGYKTRDRSAERAKRERRDESNDGAAA